MIPTFFPGPAFQCMRGEYSVTPAHKRSGTRERQTIRDLKNIVIVDHNLV
jgi:hypothetical protein